MCTIKTECGNNRKACFIEDDMNLPGLFLHPLTGNRAKIWSVRVSGNWRATLNNMIGVVRQIHPFTSWHSNSFAIG
ncbi:MAG TPA: hypothetical protein ENJ87_06515 [Gammaproteobacteria bacterium]|nr:hypothetical protein [Gammaproteobacteria bacterium]